MLKKVYSCNLCLEVREPVVLMGLRFSDNKNFTLDEARSTDGQHICMLCLQQLEKQLAAKRSAVTEPESVK